jgi:Spy/CpxP family protein refolding chaperone
MRLRTAVIAIAAGLTLASLPASAGHGPKGMGMNPILHMLSQLDLTDAQTTRVEAIVDRYDDGAMGKARDGMRDAHATLERAIHDVSASDAQVRDAAAAVAALQVQAAVEHHHMAAEISALLTPDQRAKLADMFANMKERHGPDQH